MSAKEAPSLSEVERQFADAMQQVGFNPGPIRSDTSNFVRFDAPGDKKDRANGYYKLITGDYPVGWFGDWKLSGQAYDWQYDRGEPLTDKERAHIKKEQRRLKVESDRAREIRQLEVAEDAQRMWGDAETSVEGHPYIAKKQIEIPRGLRLHRALDGTALIAVPMLTFDMNFQPKLTNIQLIGPDGRKTFRKGGRVDGCFFALKGDTSVVVLTEGVATAFSIWEATGLTVIAAFNAGNLIPVAKDYVRARPMATLCIAADDDAIAPNDWAERSGGKPWVNAGVTKAQATAKAVGCRWIKPVFKDGPANGKRTDFNDLHLTEGIEAVSKQVLGAFQTVESESGDPGAKVVELDNVQDESWRSDIPVTATGSPDGSNVYGVTIYIRNHKLLRNRLRFNSFTQMIEIDGNDIEDHHISEFRRLMHKERFKSKKGDTADEMEAVAREESYDPVLEYLGGLKWDGVERAAQWPVKYLGVEDSEYTRDVGRKFLISAVARARRPGCKVDTMLVLEGPQGTGKSTALRYLFGDRFFSDHLPDFHSKDAFMQLQGSWCIEAAELSAMTKAEVTDVKQFLTRIEDKFRPPYGRFTIKVRRRTVFTGSVNPEDNGYLKDQTGGRRFWPLACGEIDLQGILSDRDQLWAEACAAYEAREPWHLVDDKVIEEARVQQDMRREAHPWEEPIRTWLRDTGRRRVTVGEVLAEMKVSSERQTPAMSKIAGSSLRAIGWVSKPVRDKLSGKTVRVFMHPDGELPVDEDDDFIGGWDERR